MTRKLDDYEEIVGKAAIHKLREIADCSPAGGSR
jgi:hypothetical protein